MMKMRMSAIGMTLAALMLLGVGAEAADGDFVWAKAMGGTYGANGRAVAVDSAGSVYSTGYFTGTADFDPGPGTFELTSDGGTAAFLCKLDIDGDFLWAKAMGGPGHNYGGGITLDSAGNVYITGYFTGTADLDPGPGVFNVTSAGECEIFVSKLDGDGNFVWAKAMGGTGYDYGHAITLDSAGNVYTTGSFQNTADFDPGPGIYNLTSAGDDEIFVSKLDSGGEFVWAKRMGGTEWDYGLGVSVDSTGNLYTTGSFRATADFDPGLDTFELTSAGNYDVFVSKLDSDGDFLWAKAMGGTHWARARGIVLDSAGNVYTTGAFWGTADFDPGPDIFSLTSGGYNDIFVFKLDSAGDFLWAKAMGGPGNNYGEGITLDSAGNVYITGFFEDTADFDPRPRTYNLTSAGDWDVFVSKLDGDGNFVWAKAVGGAELDCGYGITLDSAGSVYTTGSFQDTADFDPGPGTFELTAAGWEDIFVSQLAGPDASAVPLAVWPVVLALILAGAAAMRRQSRP